jgi:hypothetical protein
MKESPCMKVLIDEDFTMMIKKIKKFYVVFYKIR